MHSVFDDLRIIPMNLINMLMLFSILIQINDEKFTNAHRRF